ncbi:MAG: biopolymer transporter ExbD [Acidobacteriales bacterium]|nr:biopolymer transporter ExbD [Terriglobales bacterium]
MASIVLLVPIIVFLVATDSPFDGVRIDPPKLKTALTWPEANREYAIVVIVARDSSIYFGREKVSPGSLPSRLEVAIRTKAEKRVYLRADRRANYGRIKEVLAKIGSVGLVRVVILAG